MNSKVKLRTSEIVTHRIEHNQAKNISWKETINYQAKRPHEFQSNPAQQDNS